MGPRTFPARPLFADDSERVVWEALRAGLREQDVLMHGTRFTDPEDGEVEIDLLVLMPDSGAAVIEVKGGHVTFAHGEWHQSDASGGRRVDPVGQASRGVRALKRYLENAPTWSRGPVRAAWLIALPYTPVSGAMGPQGRRDLIIGRDDLALSAGLVYDRLWDHSIQTRLPADGWVDAALDLLLGSLDESAEISARTAQRLRRADQLTADQQALLRVVRNVHRFEVTGSAGTGKTWLAMEQARRWTEAGERVCLVAYGRGVVEMVRHAMADLPPASRPAFIGTFHLLGHRWGVQPDGERDADFWEREAPELMRAAADGLPSERRYTAFVVDEAQDFADAWWPALLASAAGSDFRLAVFRDDEQAVFAERRGRPDLDLVPLTLDENLRNAQQVVDSYRPLITSEVSARGGQGYPVEYVPCDAGEIVSCADDVVASLVDERGWLPEHVALLTTMHRHPVHAERGVDKTAYWQGLWDTDDVFYSTVSGFKGLERPVIVLAVDGFHPGIDPRSVLYAGMSRARDLLVVVAPQQLIEPVVGAKAMRRLLRGQAP
jgi:hypothetical protein